MSQASTRRISIIPLRRDEPKLPFQAIVQFHDLIRSGACFPKCASVPCASSNAAPLEVCDRPQPTFLGMSFYLVSLCESRCMNVALIITHLFARWRVGAFSLFLSTLDHIPYSFLTSLITGHPSPLKSLCVLTSRSVHSA